MDIQKLSQMLSSESLPVSVLSSHFQRDWYRRSQSDVTTARLLSMLSDSSSVTIL